MKYLILLLLLAGCTEDVRVYENWSFGPVIKHHVPKGSRHTIRMDCRSLDDPLVGVTRENTFDFEEDTLILLNLPDYVCFPQFVEVYDLTESKRM